MSDAAVAALISASGLPRLEARLLLVQVAGLSGAMLLAHPEQELPTSQVALFRELCARRAQGEPIAYLTGAREFYGLLLEVSPAALIPRPETELLVELALQVIHAGARRVLDLGTGSGAIAVAIARHAPNVQVEAIDASAQALALARRNAVRHGVVLGLRQSDWFGALRGERFDLIVANPPYVARADPHLLRGDVRFEPRAALDGGVDGLDAIRAIAAGAQEHLSERGTLLLEHGYDQAQRVRELCVAAGLREVRSWRDLAAIERVSGGQR